MDKQQEMKKILNLFSIIVLIIGACAFISSLLIYFSKLPWIFLIPTVGPTITSIIVYFYILNKKKEYGI